MLTDLLPGIPALILAALAAVFAHLPGGTATSLLALLFFAPAGFIYGRYRARRAKRAAGTLKGRLAHTLPMPLLVLACFTLALLYQGYGGEFSEEAQALTRTGNGVVDFFLRLARTIGELGLILFFLSLPYLIGAFVAVVLLVLDARGRDVIPPEPERGEGEE